MALIVSKVDLKPLLNAKVHHTERYERLHDESKVAIFRRGFEFDFEIVFENRAYNPKSDKLRVVFSYDDGSIKCDIPRGGAWLTNVTEIDEDVSMWSLRKVAEKGKTLKLKMRSPVDLPVGLYVLQVVTGLRSNLSSETYVEDSEIYFLLNPWHKEDQVFMPDKELLGEYVLNDVGKVYVGPSYSPNGRHWVFGQFSSSVLKACIKLLNNCELSFSDKKDPIMLSRMISKMVNSSDDDNGVLTGNWSGSYEDGVPPSMWTSSVPILEKYLELPDDDTEGVKYGQCWVFAAVVCTICRAIGMPARVVTNFVSAHDTDASLSIDTFYNENNEPYDREDDDYEISDSVWNFHVWNDVWMARPDLPPGYGGWQAIDATPQETSDSLYQCGPASVEAIKRGETGFQYDVPFILSEVNADMIEWKNDKDSLLGIKKIKTDKKHVGQKLLTKRPFSFDPHGERDMDDVMDQYKEKEGTNEERLSLMKAACQCDRACKAYEIPIKEKNEVLFKLNDLSEIFVGNSINVIFDLENIVDVKRTVDISVTIKSMYYNGISGKMIKKVVETFELEPKSKKQLKIELTVDDYLDKLVEYCWIKSHAMATVKETNETWSGEDDFQISKPSLIIKEKNELKEKKQGALIIEFKNPLKIELTSCQLAIDSPGLIKFDKSSASNIKPLETYKIEYPIVPDAAGEFSVVAILYTKELNDIIGHGDVEVTQ